MKVPPLRDDAAAGSVMSAAKSSAANFCFSFIFFSIIIFRVCTVGMCRSAQMRVPDGADARINRRTRYYKRPSGLIIAYNYKFLSL